MTNIKTLRLILGDQLNAQHSWYKTEDKTVVYVLMQIRSETDYAHHHIQKIVGFFAAMEAFAIELKNQNHQIIFIKLNDFENQQSFHKNLKYLISKHNFTHFEYQLPDEHRLDQLLKNFCETLPIAYKVYDSEHFMSNRNELADFFVGKKTYLMESFYRHMRKKHNILMNGTEPETGQWNYDAENRKKLPAGHIPIQPLVFENDVSEILAEIKKTDIKSIGNINAKQFIWPINRSQSLLLLDFFVKECLPTFGTFQDAMLAQGWSLYHARLSFSMNTKMISPKEIIEKAVAEWKKRPNEINYNQLEGFIRQIIGWREYMRGIYWLKMPEFATMNYFENTNQLPSWYWSGKTKMNCLRDAISQSLNYAYAHHIQRLMVTGNFALLAGVNPNEVDSWYLGIYIDAIEWVEITNTRGMSQFADGGIIGSKPYVSSASYIDKQSHYCATCFYDKNRKTGEKACPFNSLYWHFYERNKEKLSKSPRIGMAYSTLSKMKPEYKAELIKQAEIYLKNINEL